MPSTRIRILHVEDVPADADLAERELRQAGFEVDIRRVETREAFLAALADFRPDLILSDYRLPEFDGMQALLLAKEHAPDVPVVITTGSVNEETAVECMKAGAADYVLKEQLGHLGTAVRSALERQRLLVGRRRARQALRESEERYRALFDGMLNGFAYCEMLWEDGRPHDFIYLAVNRAFGELTGLKDVVGRRVSEVIPGIREANPELLDFYGSVASTGTTGTLETYVGVLGIWFSISAYSPKYGHFVAVFDNVTERKKAEAELLVTQQQLAQAQKMEAVGRLAGGVAHDFNNLLTVIQGYGELLAEALAGDPEKRESVGEIVKAAERASALTRQLLAFSRQQVLETHVLDVGAVVADTEKMLKRLIGEDVEIAVVAPPALGRVKADPGQVSQVLLNLALNARDAMPEGGRLSIELANESLDAPLAAANDEIPPGRYVVLSVTDTGSGMDAETSSHVFEPFFTTKERGKGTGLGLATVYGIVRQSGGYVAVKTAPGAGTTFRIYLPRCDEPTTSGIRRSVASRRGTETILLVEDEAAVRALTRTVLERRGYSVLVAEGGAAALDVLARDSRPVHVLLTDLLMPGMNGRDLASRVRALRPATRIVFMSGYAADHAPDFAGDPAAVFLSKPFTERDLVAKIREVLDAPPA
jgi:CheY-like chemotaxis protein